MERLKAFRATRWGHFIAIYLTSVAIFAAAVAVLHLVVAVLY
jgi:hypothetical protein